LKLTHSRQWRDGLFRLLRSTSFLGIKGDGAREEAGLALFLKTVGVALDIDHCGLVEEAVQGGGGHDGVAGEDMAPFREGLVGGDDDGGLLFVAATDYLKEQRSLVAVEAEVADFV